MTDIPVSGPSITDREVAYVTEAAATNWGSKANDFIGRFERAFADHCQRRFAMSLPSCTAGLHLSLAASGVGPGDEVIVPDLTWIATGSPVDYMGATPVFADADPDTWCVSVETIAPLISPRTKVIIAVGLYGQMPDMDALQALADDAGVVLIEDAAEAFGATWGGRPAGSFGRASVFSFHGSKTMVTGEGGVLTTDDEDFLARCRFLADHGRAPGDFTFMNAEVCYKYKMSAMQAAMGLAQVERAAELLEMKRAIFSWYEERLGGRNGLRLNPPVKGGENGYWMITALIDGADKFALGERLKSKGVHTRPFFTPLSGLPAYAGRAEAKAAQERNKVAYALSPIGLNLPSGLQLTEADVDRVCKTLLEEVKP